MSKFKLCYFDGESRGETSRLLFLMSDTPYEDIRINFENTAAWEAMKDDWPMGQLPYIEINGKKYAQSRAIERFLAKRAGLYGDNEIEQLQIDMVADTIETILWEPIMAIFLLPEDKVAEATKKYVEETVPVILRRLERNLDNAEHCVGNKMTWADIALFHGIRWAEKMTEGFDLSKTPKIKGIIEKAEKHPKIAAYIAKRPKSSF